jgi:predicted ATPase/class 3 adenylate cyclase
VSAAPAFTTFLFTDIEGSTRLWEREPERMRLALARHDAVCQAAVQAHQGRIVKGTGDGIHAVFDDPLPGVLAALQLQLDLEHHGPGDPLALRVRCGLHGGPVEHRDGDFFGSVVNRAARVMSVAHGGQTLLSQSVADRVAGRLPPGVSLADLGPVRLRDLSAPERVHQLQHPRLRVQFPPLRSLESTPNNLAQQLDSFIGRDTERAEVKALLARGRLLTLLGMGGIGKSRLSVQLGAELLDEHPDGVWLVELAPLTDPRLLPQALASVLGVKEEPGQTVTDSLLAYVRDKQLLVILDNCEHVVRAAAELSKQLLQAGAGVKVLASSRDVLQVAGETVYPVPTLSVPDPQGTVDLAALARHEAVRLFVDRASAAQAAFTLDSGNAAAVAQICQRLDGIPLALELAAARTRALSVQAIAARLHDRFRLLVTGDQTVLPRQRTLRALIDWSFDLLSGPERLLFRRLAVFAGGWTLEAAEAVGAGGGLDTVDVLDLLAQLVGKSLVVMEPGGARYRMLETVRAYAIEKLAEAGDEAATRARHVVHVLALAEAAWDAVGGPEQGPHIQRLDVERENLLAAHAWCGQAADCGEQGLQLVYLLRTYWIIRGLLGLGHRVTVESLVRPAALARSAARSRLLVDAGQLSLFMGRHAEACRYLEESRSIADEIGDRRRLAAALLPLGQVYGNLGQHDRARQVHAQAVGLAEELGNRRQLAAALNALAQSHRADQELAVADAMYARVLTIARALDDEESIAIALLNRAMVAITRGDRAQARALLQEADAIAGRIRSEPVELGLFDACAGLCAGLGEWTRCARWFGAVQEQAVLTGIQRDAHDEAFLQPLVQQARDALGAEPFANAERDGRQLRTAGTRDELRAWLAAAC